MEKIVINGNKPLYGSIEVSGMKNAALPVLFATVLVGGRFFLENLPQVNDIKLSLEILTLMGAKCHRSGTVTEIDTTDIDPTVELPLELVQKMRASYYLVGAELGRFGKACVGYPGGCHFGTRPIDQHLKAFQVLGAATDVSGGYIHAEAPGGLYGSHIFFDVISVGATVNALLAAARAEGLTVIENAAREPHIVALATFLNMCGAHITGAGTDTIKVRGEKNLTGCTYDIIPDMIEAGTYMAAVAATGGRVTVTNIIPKHMESVTAKLVEMGVTVNIGDDYAEIIREPGAPMMPVKVKAVPYPGFPTDMQPQICALACFAAPGSIVTDAVWDNRFAYVDQLVSMGADITVRGSTARIEGGKPLKGGQVRSVDLRGGAAMIIAALASEGTTEISDIHLIQRGYDDIVGKLRGIGADISIVTFPDQSY